MVLRKLSTILGLSFFLILVSFIFPPLKAEATHDPDHIQLPNFVIDSQIASIYSDRWIGPNKDISMADCGCVLTALSSVINYMLPGREPWFPTIVRVHDSQTYLSFNKVTPFYLDDFLREGNKQTPAALNWGFEGAGKQREFRCNAIPRANALERIVKPLIVHDGSGQGFEVGDTGVRFFTRDKFDAKARILTREWLRGNAAPYVTSPSPVVVAYKVRDNEGKYTGFRHAVVITGFNPDTGEFSIANPYGGKSSVPNEPGQDYSTWEDDIFTVIFPIPVHGSARYFEFRDDPAEIDMLTISPDGKRSGVDGTTGTQYEEDPAVTLQSFGEWQQIATETATPSTTNMKNMYIRKPKPGLYRLQVVGKETGDLKLSLVDTTIFNAASDTTMLTIDEPITAGDVKKFEMGYSGNNPAQAESVVSFTPEARAGNDMNGMTGRALSFNGLASFDHDGTIESYAWNFGDGTTATGELPSHSYSQPGTYDITLTVTDNTGRTASDGAKATIILAQQKPVAQLTGPYLGIATKEIFIDGGASFDRNNDALTYRWDFGDGQTETTTDSYLRHTYEQPGTYETTLVVNDGKEDSLPARVSVTILEHTPLTLSAPLCVNPGETVAVSLNNISNRSRDRQWWDFSEGSLPTFPTAEEAEIRLNYLPYGLLQGVSGRPAGFDTPLQVSEVQILSELHYSLQLRWLVPSDYEEGTHQLGIRGEPGFREYATVQSPCPALNNNAPRAHAGGPRYTATVDRPFILDGSRSSDSDGDTLTYEWDLGTGETATGEKPSYTYKETGRFFVRLQVTDGEKYSPITKQSLAIVDVTETPANEPPLCTQAKPSSLSLWPPNHKFIPLSIQGITDPDNDPVTITITDIKQDEPVNAEGDGNTGPDAKILGNRFELRAERSGQGNGRVYHVTVNANDGNSGSCSRTVTVGVPHDKKDRASDEGALYDSTITP